MKLQNIVKTPAGTAAIAAFICGIFTHLFALANVIHNYDDICMLPYGYGTGLSSGRWFLEVLGYLFGGNGGNFNLPTINGILFLLILAVSAGFLVSIFHIRNRFSAALMGMLFVVFPTVTATMLFRYTVIYNGIAILFSVLAAWVLHRFRFGMLLSACLLCLSLGIYQAYIPITIGIFVLSLIQEALEGNASVGKLVLRGLYACGALVLGLLLYFVCLRILLKVTDSSLSHYQGVHNMGKLSLPLIPGLVKEAFSSFCTFVQDDYCGLANIPPIQLAYRCLGILTIGILGYLLAVQVKKPDMVFALCLLCLIFPVAINFIVIMCPESHIYTLMVYSFVLVGCAPLVLAEYLLPMEGVGKKCRAALAKGIASLTLLLIFCYGYYANVNYSALYFANRQVENYLNSMVVQIRMTEGFDTQKQWAFLGRIEDPLLDSLWSREKIYGGNANTDELLNAYSNVCWIENYIGYTIPQASSGTIQELANTDTVKSMPCWPNAGSIKVIGNTVVIKCQELSSP